MFLARYVVHAVRVEHRSASEVARSYGISRSWVYRLLDRYDTDGEAAFQPRSRAPKRTPHRTSAAVEDQIVALRKQLLDAGLDAGAHTIAWHLARTHPHQPLPSTATIWRILTRRGQVTPQPQKRPRASYLRFQADLPNECWQADITHWRLADGADVEILNILDDHSRLLITSTARPVFTAVAVAGCFTDAFTRHGQPACVLTDNGAVFTANYRRGRTSLEHLLGQAGIGFKHSRPYHPQTQGKIERLHQTLKRWLTKQPPAAGIIDLNAALAAFTDLYNTARPHRALGRATPAQAYTARAKATPDAATRGIDRHYRVRTDTIDSCGKLTLRHAGRLHHIGIGARWKHTPVKIAVADLHVRISTPDGTLIRELILDPTRDYQPQKKTPPANS